MRRCLLTLIAGISILLLLPASYSPKPEGEVCGGPVTFNANFVANTIIIPAVPAYNGAFTLLTCSNTVGGTCTTPPKINVFDGSTNVGATPLGCPAAATIHGGTAFSTQAETLAFNGGDQIGVYISTAGTSCNIGFSVCVRWHE